jgi:penicillin-binding protein 1B
MWRRYALLSLGVLLVVGTAAYVFYLDRLVARQFEGRRWNVPAKVYAAPVELYSGAAFSATAIVEELQRLQYREVSQVTRVGQYNHRNERITVHLRAAQFADERRPAMLIQITTAGKTVRSIYSDAVKDLAVVRLEPLYIGSVLPIESEDRVILAPEEVPAALPAALQAVEDKHFATHGGIHLKSMMRALWVNVRSGELRQGGSTLTQQLVKNYFLDSKKTLRRKLAEIVMAIALERRFSKADIMNAYINEVYLGQDGARAIHGFGLASQFYFGRPLGELDASQIALLVALVKGPSYYDPRRFPQRALERRNQVLQIISQSTLISQPLTVTARASGQYYPAFLDLVHRTLRRDYRDEDLRVAGLKIFTTLEPRAQSMAQDVAERELVRLERTQRGRKSSNALLEGAIVVTVPQSGEVVALVGGRRTGVSGFNRALDARRSIGSLIKPFVYLAALQDKGYHALTTLQDLPVTVRLSDNSNWQPRNYDGTYNGLVPLVYSLAESLNLATVNLGLSVGVANVAKKIRSFGFESAIPQVPALLLGALEASPLEVAQLYGGLASGGFRVPLRAVRAVISADGKTLKGYPLELTAVADANAVYQLNQMLTQVMQNGTGKGAYEILPRDLRVAGKTGTSSASRDNWFAGFSATHLAVVWVGDDANQATTWSAGRAALPIWSHVMAQLNTVSWDLPPPDTVYLAEVDYRTGEAVPDSCVTRTATVAVPSRVTIKTTADCPMQAVP